MTTAFSTGRTCGPMFTTALSQKLTKVDATKKSLGHDDGKQGHTENQEETLAEFTMTVHEHLLEDVGRRGYEHGLTFGAQDDAWQMCWGERTGIPPGRIKERWDNLQDWAKDATLHVAEPPKRDAAVTKEQLAEYHYWRNEAEAKGKQDMATSDPGRRTPWAVLWASERRVGSLGALIKA